MQKVLYKVILVFFLLASDVAVASYSEVRRFPASNWLYFSKPEQAGLMLDKLEKAEKFINSIRLLAYW